MIYNHQSKCAHCGSPIEPGQKWVREKVYEPVPIPNAPNYRRYHAELFNGRELSCWEKHWMGTELRRIGYAA